MPLNGSTYASGGDGLPQYAGNGTDGAFFWGGQLEQRSALSAYTATTTAPISNYVPVLLTAGGGQPRFDHNPTTSESLGLLIEEQRTNILVRSEDFSTTWVTEDVSVTTNNVIAPNGTQTADTIVANTGSSDHSIYQTTSLTGTYTSSVYAKACGVNYLFIGRNNSAASDGAFFNLTTGVVSQNTSGGTATITSVGNGWYRCSLATTFSSYVLLALSTNGTSFIYTGDGFSGVSLWGAQCEAGAFPTSYIATTSAAATRAADVVSMTGANFSSWYSPGNGTFYAEASTASTASDVMIAEATNSAGSFLDFSLTFATTSTQFINRFVASNNDMRRSSVVAANTMVKFSGSLTNSPATTLASANGVAMTAIANQALLTGADRMFIGSRGGSSLFLNAPIRKFAFYPAQLTQTQQNSITG
jgi:hypothetical protein